MKNYNAEKVNQRLGVTIFNESNHKRLELVKYTQKEIKNLSIDDLIDKNGKGTERLARLVKDIIFGL